MRPIQMVDLKGQYTKIKDEVDLAIRDVLETTAFINGKQVTDFSRNLSGYLGIEYVIPCANGTDALLLALRALDVGRGDEVLTTPFTFFATAGAVHNVGARPVFADIDPDTFNLSGDTIAAAVKPSTRAIIAVDLFGQMAPIEAIMDAAGDVPVIEDAAQSIGARRKVNDKWVMAGEAATIGTFSFFPSKNLGGYGDGGMMVTQSDDLATRLRRLRTHGGLKTYYHEEVGYNSRLDALQAAVLSAKLPMLASWSAARRKNAAYYNAAFADVEGVRTPTIDPANESIYNQYTLRVARREDLQAHLKAKEIGSAIYYPLSLHLQPCFEYLGCKRGAYPESEKATREVISLPVYPELQQSQLDEVIEAVRGFYGR